MRKEITRTCLIGCILTLLVKVLCPLGFLPTCRGYDKNWLWRGDQLWFDRWQQLWSLSVVGKGSMAGTTGVPPDNLVERLWRIALHRAPQRQVYVAFGTSKGDAPFNYALGMPHDGWRQLLPYMITMWKTGTATVTQRPSWAGIV